MNCLDTRLLIVLLPLGLAGCGGGGSASRTAAQPIAGFSEGYASTNPNARATLTQLIAVDLESPGTPDEGDSGTSGTGRIRYTVPENTRLKLDLGSETGARVAFVSASGTTVLEASPEQPVSEGDVPAGEYDLVLTSTGADPIRPLFIQGHRQETGRNPVQSYLYLVFNRKCAGCNMEGGYYYLGHWVGVDLEYARMRNASFWKSNITNANFARARMEGANLSGCYGDGANFEEAWMGSVNLTWTSGKNWNFKFAQLGGADFEGANLPSANLENAGTNGEGGIGSFRNASFVGAKLGTLQRLDLTGADFSNAILNGARDCRFDGTKLDGARFINSRHEQFDAFSNSVFRNVTFRNTNLSGARFMNSSFENASFVNANAQGANFSSSRFTRTSFTDSDLQNANLSSTNHSVVQFIRSNTAGVRW